MSAGSARAWRRARRGLAAAVVLIACLLVPDSAPAPTQVSLVSLNAASGLGIQGRDIVWILAVGSDARAGENMLRSRGDAVQLVGLDARRGTATAIGIPRDSWVRIPGHWSDRVNAGMMREGPRGMARAVEHLTGISADMVLVTRFPWFEQMVADIGPITVTNPRRFGDEDLKKEGFPRGRVRLSGYDAMAFARIRKSLPGGDFDRSANQQRVLRGIADRVRERAGEPGFVEGAVSSLMRHTDTNANPAELFELAQAVAAVRAGRITTCVLRGRPGWVGPASVVFPDLAFARRVGRDARDGVIGGC